MSNYQRDYHFLDGLLSQQISSIRNGDSTRRMIFQNGNQGFQTLQKKGDDTFPISQMGQEDRYYQLDLDSMNQTNNPLKLNNTSIMSKSDLKFGNFNRPSLLSVDRNNRLDTQGLASPKALVSPKETLRSYSNIISSYQYQQNSMKDLDQKSGGNKFGKSKTLNNLAHSSDYESIEKNIKKESKLRKSKTQRINDETKTERIKKSRERNDEELEDLDEQEQNDTIFPRTCENIEKGTEKEKENGKEQGLDITWKKRGIAIITQVKKFLHRLQNLSRTHIYNNQTMLQFNVINDKSAFFDEKRKIQLYKKTRYPKYVSGLIKYALKRNCLIQRIITLFVKHIKIIEPDSFIIISWMIVMVLTLLSLLFLNPIFMAFQDEMEQQRYTQNTTLKFCMSRLPLFIQLADVLIRLNTIYYKRGLVVGKRWSIARHYIKHKMWLDGGLTFLYIIYDNQNLNILMIVTVLLIKKITQVVKEFEDAINLDKKQQAYYSLGKLSVFVIFIAHFCGCIFWSVGVQTMSFDRSWVTDKFTDKTFFEKYISSLYWATVTMLTVGYGDITPINEIEKCFVIVIMIFSCGIYAYSLNQIGVLIEEITYEDKEFKQIYSQLSLFLKKRNLDVKFQTEVKRYYQYLHYEKHNYTINGEAMLNPLKQSLKEKVIENINYQLLIKYKLFKYQFSKEFLEKVALTMKEVQFTADDKVWESDDLPNNNRMFFIIRGQVQESVKNQFVVKKIEEGGYFNEKCFVIDETPNISFVSTCLSTLVCLDKKDFLEVIRNFPVDYERYCKFKDGSKFSTNFNLDSKCETCEMFTHSFNRCPQVNLFINKPKLIYNLNQWTPHLERGAQTRRDQYEINQSTNSISHHQQAFLNKEKRIKKRFNARSEHMNVLEIIVDYLINKNPFGLDDDNLIEYMKMIYENNDNLGDQPSPDQVRPGFGQIVSQLDQNKDSKHKSILMQQMQALGSRFIDEIGSPPKQVIRQIHVLDEMYSKQFSGQESQVGSHQYFKQQSKTSTRGYQQSISGAVGGVGGGGQFQSQLQQNSNTPQASNQQPPSFTSRRFGMQNHTKTTSQTEIPSNENLKEVPNVTDFRQTDKYRSETQDYSRRRVSTTNTKSQNFATHSQTHNSNGNSPYHSLNQQMLQSNGVSSLSAPLGGGIGDMNSSQLSIERGLNNDIMFLQSNEQDEINVSEALKNLQSKKFKGYNQNNPNINANNPNTNNNSTFTILEEETQENQTNFQHTFHRNTILEKQNTSQVQSYPNEESSFPQPDLFPKVKEDYSQAAIPSTRLIVDTDRSLQGMNNQSNPIILNSYQNPGSLNTPVAGPTNKRNSISNKIANYIRSSSYNNNIAPNSISPMNKKNAKAFLFTSNSREQQDFLQQMNSNAQNSKGGGSQYGQQGDDILVNSNRNRKKTDNSLHKQQSFQKHYNRIKEDATPKNNQKPKESSHNFIPSLQNLQGQLLEDENIAYINHQKQREFSDLPELDKHNVYTEYFPNNNITIVMAELNLKYEKQMEQERKKKKSQSNMTKLEKFMLKLNTKRTISRNKTRKSESPMRKISKKRTMNPPGFSINKSTFHNQHSMNKI